jgi:hypothetical protein
LPSALFADLIADCAVIGSVAQGEFAMKTRLLISLCASLVLILAPVRSQAAEEKQTPRPMREFRSDRSPCTEVDIRSVEVPDDFRIAYGSGPSHAHWAGRRTFIEVNASGQVKLQQGSSKGGQSPMGDIPVKSFRISKEKVKKIFARVQGCRFFELDKHYSTPGIMDGGGSHLFVQANGQSHWVSVRYASVARYSAIVDTLCRQVNASSSY